MSCSYLSLLGLADPISILFPHLVKQVICEASCYPKKIIRPNSFITIYNTGIKISIKKPDEITNYNDTIFTITISLV